MLKPKGVFQIHTENKEVWKPIEGYEEIYEVSNLGRVKSLSREVIHKNGTVVNLKTKILKEWEDTTGYNQLKLTINKTPTIYMLHRLVASAFIPNPNNYPEVNHKDEIKTNNNVENLEWCTKLYNMNYGENTKNMHRGLLEHNVKMRRPINQLTLDMKLIKTWESATECGRNGYSSGTVSACANRYKSFKTYRGCIWRYADE